MPQESLAPSENSLNCGVNFDAQASSEPQRRAWSLAQLPKPVLRWLGILSVLLITITSFWLAFNAAWILEWGHWGYVGAFIVSMVASATVLLPAPGMAIVISMGPALNPFLLALVAGMGSGVGEFTGYLAGATGQALIPEQQRMRYDQIRDLTRKYGPALLFFFSAIPFPFFDLAGIVAGALRMRPISFFIAVTAGKTIKYTVLILLGASSIQYIQQWLQQFNP